MERAPSRARRHSPKGIVESSWTRQRRCTRRQGLMLYPSFDRRSSRQSIRIGSGINRRIRSGIERVIERVIGRMAINYRLGPRGALRTGFPDQVGQGSERTRARKGRSRIRINRACGVWGLPCNSSFSWRKRPPPSVEHPGIHTDRFLWTPVDESTRLLLIHTGPHLDHQLTNGSHTGLSPGHPQGC
jgi:hypothetical protein